MPRGRKPKSQQLPIDNQKPYGSALEYNRQIGQNLHEIIKKYYKNTAQVQKLFNVTDFALEQYKNGEMEVPAHLLWRMANHLHIPIETFFTSQPKTSINSFFPFQEELKKSSVAKIFCDASDKTLKP